MKKIVSLFLALIIACSCLTVAFAEDQIYTCPYSKYEFVKTESGSYSYELVYCGKTFSTEAAYTAHVLTCPYHTGSTTELTLTDVIDALVRIYKVDTKVWSIIVPVVLWLAETIQKLASGQSPF